MPYLVLAPGTGSQGGALIEILSPVAATASFAVPAGTGKPGWLSKSGSVSRHAYSNTLAPGGPTPIKKMLGMSRSLLN